MSYDIRLGVKVAGADNLFAVIDEPEYSSPTYNLGDMFRACTGWDFNQGEWYKVSDVLPLIERGIHELTFNKSTYKQYEPDNGFGTLCSALEALESVIKCIKRNTVDGDTWNEIPLDCLYMCW